MRFPAFVENINKLLDLWQWSESDFARWLSAKPQQVNEWRKGLHAPSRGWQLYLALALSTDAHTLMRGEIGAEKAREIIDRRGPPLSMAARRILESFEAILRRADSAGDKKLLGQIRHAVDFMDAAVPKAEARKLPDIEVAIGDNIETAVHIAHARERNDTTTEEFDGNAERKIEKRDAHDIPKSGNKGRQK